MDEILLDNLIKNICLGIGVVGVLVGLDLFFGARIISILKQILDKGTDIIDKSVLSAQSKKMVGAAIVILSLAIVFLITRIKV